MNNSETVNIADLISPGKNFDNIGQVVTIVVNNAFVLAAFLAFIFILIAGFGILVGGAGDPKKAEQSKQMATYAVIGFLVIIFSFWIVQLIGSLIGRNILEF
jgi:hypothetical protein